MKDNYGWELSTGWVLLNPFTLSLDASEAELKNEHSELVLSFSEAEINLSLASIWKTGWVLDKISLQNIFLTVSRLTETEFNFSSLIPPEQPDTEPTEEKSGIPGVTIHELDIHSDRLTFIDLARANPYESNWDGLHVKVGELSTVFEEVKPYTIDLKADGGGTLRWEGEISIPQSRSSGLLVINDMNLRKLWEFASPFLSFELTQGNLSVSGNYALQWQETLSYNVNNASVGLVDINVLPKNVEELPDTSISLPMLAVDNINVDSEQREISMDKLSIDSLSMASWMEGSTISLTEGFLPSTEEENTADVTKTKKEETQSATSEPVPNDWQVTLKEADLNNINVSWRSPFTMPETLSIEPINANIKNISWPFSGETDATLSASFNQATKIVLTAKLALASGAGDIAYDLQNLVLPLLNPNLPAPLQASIQNGNVDVTGTARLAGFMPSNIALEGNLNDFVIHTNVDDARISSLDSVGISGLNVDMENRDVLINNIDISGLVGRIHINQDGSINASNVWQTQSTDAKEVTTNENSPESESPWSFKIPSITFANSDIDFMDESLPINFRTVVGDMEGEILNLDSTPGAFATVDIKGAVDQYAPVLLSGTLSPFNDPLALDLNLTFDSIDMATLSPYSGTYAGYAMNSGLLNLDLQYQLQNNKLKGDNSLRIDKLQLGDKIESDKAVDLPLKLALAILTDANGVIDMQVPVSGDVDDPKFGLGSVIAGAFFNVITKVITSPFSLLASLAGSDEDLQRIEFLPGSSELTEGASKRLNALAQALGQRPQLSVLISGRIQSELDELRLQIDILEQHLLEGGLSKEEVDTRGTRWESAIFERYNTLELSEKPETITVEEQYNAVVKSISVPTDALTSLAQARAIGTKTYLINQAGLATDRAVVGQSPLDDEANTFSGVELSIDN